MSDPRWTEAMEWWKTSPNRELIRMTADTKLSQLYAGTGQGISSSDTNHEVFHIYLSWLHYVNDYCKPRGVEPNMGDFLTDYLIQ